jgi:hypothetical protein
MKSPTSTGQCLVCKGTFSKSAMTRHLKVCLTRSPAASAASAGKPFKAFHLLVEGRHAPDYWLHLEVPVAATLERLDRFLRAIWLECCGHMSAFRIQGVSYSVSPMRDPLFGAREFSMKKKLYEVLSPGLVFEHEYDFGSSTHLKLKVVGELQRTGGPPDILLLARNHPPAIPCETCGQPATKVCSQCLWDREARFCDKCAAAHECGEETLLPVVNSPRVGTCGYRG